MTYSEESLYPLSAAVGRVFIEWNRIESVIVELTHRMAACISAPLMGEAGDVLRLALMNMELKGLVDTAKVYGLKCNISDDFYLKLEKLLDQVIGHLREERNKYAHSLWYCDIDNVGPSRVKIRARVVKPQGRLRDVTTATVKDYPSLEEAAAFGAHLAKIYMQISELDGRVCQSDAFKRNYAVQKR